MGRFKEGCYEPAKGNGLEQKGVMAVWRFNIAVADKLSIGSKSINNFFRLSGSEQPVTCKADYEESGFDIFKCLFY
ncbi:hypothetical protein ES703_41640 [subsurface metagenome]